MLWGLAQPETAAGQEKGGWELSSLSGPSASPAGQNPLSPSVMSLGYVKLTRGKWAEKEPSREGIWMPGGDGCAE